MRRRRVTQLAVIAALGVVGAACVPVTAPPPPPPTPKPPPPPPAPLVNKSNVVSGLNKPWDIAFVPGATGIAGSMLYTENDAGTVSVYISSSERRRVLITLPGVDTGGEGGAMGIAVDPDYANNHDVYVCYTTGADNRVTRFDTILDGMGRPQSLMIDTDIVIGMAKNFFHNGCRIRFDPSTGTANPALFVSMGDAGTGTTPQDADSLNGKVLRVERDGDMYPGNLSTKKWFARGHRNPQGLAFRPADGAAYSAEHGPNVNDEINRLPNGGNAGWDPYDATAQAPFFYTSSHAMTDHNLGGDVFDPIWSSGNRTIAISGIEFLNGAAWGNWSGRIVGAMLKDHELRMFNLNGTGELTGTVELYDDTITRLRVPVLGPDGAIYVATDEASPNGQIWKFTKG